MPVIHSLREEIRSGSKTYPVFVGFLPAEEILQIAEAPHFTKRTSNEEIASKLDVPPIKDWQRPLIGDKIDSIVTLFSDMGEFMPNPVLLSENVLSAESDEIELRQQTSLGGAPTKVWEIEIPAIQDGHPKPLWILDGQHRITGLAESAQADNPVPIVILLNQRTNVYDGSDLAKIFAQVTTQATKLDPLHNEWLTYAFGLEDYSDTSTKQTAHRQSMQSVAQLCSLAKLGDPSINNPFLNRIQFNAQYQTSAPEPGGFTYDCIELKKLIFRHYYDAASVATRLAPKSLAIELGLAHEALRRVVQEPQEKTVFFGDTDHGQKTMQNAFLVGVMTYLLRHARPDDWYTVLHDLGFQRTNWNFSWVRSLSGSAQTVSRRIALDVFGMVFRDRDLPTGVDNLADYLKGDGAMVEFAFSHVLPSERASRKDKADFSLPMGSKKSTVITPRSHVKISDVTPNIGKVVVQDTQRPLVDYKSIPRRGLKLKPKAHTNPLMLTIAMHHYGDTMSSAEFEITWQ